MTSVRYDNSRRGSDDYYTSEYRTSRSRPRYYDTYDYESTQNNRSPSRDIIRYNDDQQRRHSLSSSREYKNYDYDYDESRRSSNDRDYDYSDRRDHNSNHEHHHEHHKHHDKHHGATDLAATVLGGIIGGTAGRKVSHGSGLSTAAGVLIGAVGAHELEKGWEKHEKKERKEERREAKEARRDR